MTIEINEDTTICVDCRNHFTTGGMVGTCYQPITHLCKAHPRHVDNNVTGRFTSYAPCEAINNGQQLKRDVKRLAVCSA